MTRVFKFTAMAFACVLGLTSTVSAQDLITWQPSVQMFNDTDSDGDGVPDIPNNDPAQQEFVNTNGTLAYAINPTSGGADGTTVQTINGVEFVNTNLVSLGSVTGPTGVTMSTTMPNENATAFQDGSFNSDADIFNVIRSAFWNPGDITFSGLTPGAMYEVQIMVNDARGTRTADFVCALSDGVNPIEIDPDGDGVLEPNVGFFATARHSQRVEVPDPMDPTMTILEGEPSGDSITGSFTASGTTQTFSLRGSTNGGVAFNSGGRAQLNGIQLRDVSGGGPIILGDSNTDGIVNFLDISPFISILLDNTAGSALAVDQSDINRDGIVNFLDIALFITILANA